MGTKRQRAPHFIAGLGDGNVRNQPRLNNDDLFPASQRLTPYIRSRRTDKAVSYKASIFNKDAFSGSGDGIPTAATTAGPWQISAMALLCIMGLLVGLFLHLVMDSTEKSSYPHRRVRARTHSSPTKKKKTDEWSDDEQVEDDDYVADGKAAVYYHGRPHLHGKSNSGTLHHRMPSVSTYKGPSSSRHAGSSTAASPGPTLRTTCSIDSGTGVSSRGGTRPVMEGGQQQTASEEDLAALKSPWRGVTSTAGMNARPLSPISSFASIGNQSNTLDTSIDTHEGDEETGTPPRASLYQGAASFDYSQQPSSRLLSAGTEDDFETPRAGTRGRSASLGQYHGTSLPPPPIYEAPTAAPDQNRIVLPFMPDLAIHEAGSELLATEQSPRPMSIDERRLVDLQVPAAWQGSNDSHAAAAAAAAYPGHIHQRSSPREAPPSSNEARKNIVHKREDITHCTDAESSLMSSVDFKEISLEQCHWRRWLWTSMGGHMAEYSRRSQDLDRVGTAGNCVQGHFGRICCRNQHAQGKQTFKCRKEYFS